MQSDQELIIMCKPPEPTVIQNKAAGFAGSFPGGARVSGKMKQWIFPRKTISRITISATIQTNWNAVHWKLMIFVFIFSKNRSCWRDTRPLRIWSSTLQRSTTNRKNQWKSWNKRALKEPNQTATSHHESKWVACRSSGAHRNQITITSSNQPTKCMEIC